MVIVQKEMGWGGVDTERESCVRDFHSYLYGNILVIGTLVPMSDGEVQSA